MLAALLVIAGSGFLVCGVGWCVAARRDRAVDEPEAVEEALEPYLCLRHTADCGHDGQWEYGEEVYAAMVAGYDENPPGGGSGLHDDLGVSGEQWRRDVEMFTAMWHAGDVPVVPGRIGERAS